MTTLLALWLFFSGALWNSVIVAILVFLLSLILTGVAVRPPPPAHA